MTRAWIAVVSLAVVSVMLTSGVGMLPFLSGLSPAPAPPVHSGRISGADGGFGLHGGLRTVVGAAAMAPAGGSTFFTNQSVPYIPNASQPCIATYLPPPACYKANVTNDPSLNLTSQGILGLAYTAFTNQTQCGNGTSAQSAIAFSSSKNFGANWTAPLYLGNPVCNGTQSAAFASAWMPSLTSLANGTFVLVYLEYNFSAPPAYPTPEILPNQIFGIPGYSNVADDRLVLTESYDDGRNWTVPIVLNSSLNGSVGTAWSSMRPWVTAYGRTIYVAWANETETVNGNFYCPPFCGWPSSPLSVDGSSQVHLLVSTDGGTTWGATIDLPVRQAAGGPYWAMNPVDEVLPDGRLAVAYDTNLTPGNASLSQWYHGDVVAAVSSNNGSSFVISTIAAGVALDWESGYRNSFWNKISTLPEMAYGPAAQQLYATFSLETPYANEEVFLANASTAGSGNTLRWAVHAVTSFSAIGNTSSAQWDSEPFFTERYDPVVAVNDQGVVQIAATIRNLSETAPIFAMRGVPFAFGAWAEFFSTSSDSGRSFTPAVRVNTFPSWWPPWESGPYEGEYGSLVSAGGMDTLAWNEVTCPLWNTSTKTDCGYAATAPGLIADVQSLAISRLYVDPGVNVTFRESGLPNGTNWSIRLADNPRVASAPASITFTGVPPNENLSWTIAPVDAGYGARYEAVATSLPSPRPFASSTTISVTFHLQYLVNISSNPLIPDSYLEDRYGFLWWDLAFRAAGACYLYETGPGYFLWDNPFCAQINYNVTPEPGEYWEDAGSTLNLSSTPNLIPTCNAGAGFCGGYYIANFTFLGWSGTGAGSANTTGNTTALQLKGPINETANFDYIGWCTFDPYGSPPLTCLNSNATFSFEEHGLPSGTNWSVSTWSPGGNNSTVATTSSNQTTLSLLAPTGGGPLDFAVWTIPGPTNGSVWVGTADTKGPLTLPLDGEVTVNFTLRGSPPSSVPLVLQTNGLPNATSRWGASLDGAGGGWSGVLNLLSVVPGAHSLNVSTLYLPNGTAYEPTLIEMEPFEANATTQSSTGPSIDFDVVGGAVLNITFSPAYRVRAVAALGGSVSPSLSWVLEGDSIEITATASAGFLFEGWSGAGAGSNSSSNATILVTPSGPVDELATFRSVPAPVAEIQIDAHGIPSDQAFSVDWGSREYSGNGSIVLVSVPLGDYSFVPLIAFPNSSALSRFVPSGWTSTLPTGPGGVVDVLGNGSISVNYTSEFRLLVTSTGPGTTVPANGSWPTAGSVVTIAAMPQAKARFLGWTGSGAGAFTGSQNAATVTMLAPIAEVAEFTQNASISTIGFSVAVASAGLPAGTNWSFTAGGGAAEGSNSTLMAFGVSGTVTLSVAIVYPPLPGIRYVPSPSTKTLSVARNTTVQVTFLVEYQVDLLAGNGGTINTSGGWFAPGSVVDAVAEPANDTEVFLQWNGTAANTSTPELRITVDGPVTEWASFGRAASSGPNSLGTVETWGLGIVLFAGLLGVGSVIGALAVRRRHRGSVQVEQSEGTEFER